MGWGWGWGWGGGERDRDRGRDVSRPAARGPARPRSHHRRCAGALLSATPHIPGVRRRQSAGLSAVEASSSALDAVPSRSAWLCLPSRCSRGSQRDRQAARPFPQLHSAPACLALKRACFLEPFASASSRAPAPPSSISRCLHRSRRWGPDTLRPRRRSRVRASQMQRGRTKGGECGIHRMRCHLSGIHCRLPGRVSPARARVGPGQARRVDLASTVQCSIYDVNMDTVVASP